MSVNITIKEGGEAKTLTAEKLRTNIYGGGTCLWVPENEVQLEMKNITENGTYTASDDGYYGFSQVTVNVPGGSGGPPGGKGSSVVGKNPSGNETMVEVDDSGNIIETELPSSIEVVTPPTVLQYGDRAYISFDGIEVNAYLADGNAWSDETHPEGEIAQAELITPVTIADYEAAESGFVARQDSIVNENGLLSENNGTRTPVVKTNDGRAAALISTNFHGDEYGGGWFGILMISTSSSAVEMTVSPKATWTYTLGEQAIYGSLVSSNQMWGGATMITNPRHVPVTSSKICSVNRTPTDAEMEAILNFLSFIPGHIGSQVIPVQWERPGDGKLLEAYFEITVIPGPGQGDITGSMGEASGGGGHTSGGGAGRD